MLETACGKMIINPTKLMFDIKANSLYKSKPDSPCAAHKDTFEFSKKLLDQVSNLDPEKMFSDVFRKHQEFEISHRAEAYDNLFEPKSQAFIKSYMKLGGDLTNNQTNKAKIFYKKCYDGFMNYMNKNSKNVFVEAFDLHFSKKDIKQLFKEASPAILKESNINNKAELGKMYLSTLDNIVNAHDGKVVERQKNFMGDRKHEIVNNLAEFRAITANIVEGSDKLQISAHQYNNLLRKTEEKIIKTINRYEFFLDKGLDKNTMNPKDVFGLSMEYAEGQAKSNKVKIKIVGADVLDDFENGVQYKDECGQKRVNDYDLYTIFSNLIQNAAKYSKKGSEVVVKLGKKNVGGHDVLQFSVKDQGIGIKAGDVEKVLNGDRAQNAIESGIDGSGYGLQRVNKILQFMNSKLEFVSPSNPLDKKFPGVEIKFSIPCLEN